MAGTAPYAVRLATTRTPSGEDEATVQPGQTVVLRSDDVAWGETIDGRLEYTARDGSGDTFVDELDEYSFTRPTKEDCDAVAAPTDPHPAPTASASSTSTTAPAPSGGASSTGTSPTTSGPAGSAGSDGGGADGGAAPPQRVVAGTTVTLQASGFLPGERVTIRLRGSHDVLGSAVAGPDGTVQAEIRIPGGTAAGPATVGLVGDDSAVVAEVQLRVAASEAAVAGKGAGDLVPLTAAAVALVVTVGALVSVAGHRRSGRPLRHA